MDTVSAFFETDFDVTDKQTSRKARKRLAKREAKTEDKIGKTNIRYPKALEPKTQKQSDYIDSLRCSDLVVAIGGAGTGKTYVAARFALRELLDGNVSKIVMSRPNVSRPEHRLGFLPGNDKMKMEPWLVPLVSAMKEETDPRKVEELLKSGKIEVVAFEHMRGRTFKDSFVLLDEAQNCTVGDLRLFLTRVGEDSRVVISGDTDQVDINNSGLATVVSMISKYKLTADVIEFGPGDVIRSKIAREWVQAFAKESKKTLRT